jgi:hypothetical protein
MKARAPIPVARDHQRQQRARDGQRAVRAEHAADPHEGANAHQARQRADLVDEGEQIEQGDRTGEDRRPVTGQEVERRGDEIRPSDQAEDAPPVRAQLHQPRPALGPVRERHDDQECHAGRPPVPLSAGAPDQNHRERHQHVPERLWQQTPGLRVLRVDHEDADREQRPRSRQHVPPYARARLASAQPAAEGQRNRHPDDEEEGREHDVGDRHAVRRGRRVEQEGGRAADSGHLVDEEHEPDVGATDQVHGDDARRRVRRRDCETLA